MRRTSRQAVQLAAFWNHCSEIAAVLDEASKYGSAPGLEKRYQHSRTWLLAHYTEFQHITTPLLPDVRAEVSRLAWGEQGDLLQRLFAAPTLPQAVQRLGRDLVPSLAAAWALLDAREALLAT